MNTNKPQDAGHKLSTNQNAQKPRPDKDARATNPKETAQEAVHQVMPKDAAKKLSKQVPARDAMPPPMVAAKGSDELMSQPQKGS